jgi:hypothetical protein
MKTIKKMLNGLALTIFVIGLLPMVGVAVEDSGKSNLPSQTEKAEYEQLFGKIADLDITENRTMLTLQKPESGVEKPSAPVVEHQMKFALDKGTQITDGTKELNLSDLEIGQHVRIMFIETWFGKRIAQTIVIQK